MVNMNFKNTWVMAAKLLAGGQIFEIKISVKQILQKYQP